MADNLKGIPFSSDDEGRAYAQVARELVAASTGCDFNDTYVVWFSYVLGNWKALISTSVADGKYFEVTHSKDRELTFLDTYVKVDNQEFTDAQLP